MARSSNYTYDPSTGQWSKNPSSDSNTNTNTKSSNENSNLTSSNSNKNSSTGSVEKKYNSIEINTLEGTLNFIVTKQTIKLKAGDTVKIKGIGKHLSGSYYVKDITRQINSSGYSHNATLIKTNFGNSIKVSTSSKSKSGSKKKVKEKVTTVQSSQKASSTPQRIYTVKKGDCLWSIAKKFYGKGSAYTKIYDANTKQVANPKTTYIGQVLIIS